MRAVRFEPGLGLILDAACPEPEPGPGEALVRLRRGGIAPADLAVVRGEIPFAGVLGHEGVGVVERLHDSVPQRERGALEGKRVVVTPSLPCGQCDLCKGGLFNHCRQRRVLGCVGRDGCLRERFTAPSRTLSPVPANVDDDAAALAAPLAGALHAAQITRIEGKPYVTVLGDTASGLLTAQVMARLNASVRLLGADPERFGLCEKWGVKHRHEAEVGRRQDQDVVVDCTGTPAGLALAARLVRPRGKIVLHAAPVPVAAPWAAPRPPAGGPAPGEAELTRDLSLITAHEIEVLGARCGHVPDALALLARGQVDVAGLITRRARLDDAAGAFALAAQPRALKVLLDPG